MSGNLVMPGVDSVRCPVWTVWTVWTVSSVNSVHGGSARFGRRLALLALELQVGGKAHRVDAVLLNRFLVAGGEFGVVVLAGAGGVVDVV